MPANPNHDAQVAAAKAAAQNFLIAKDQYDTKVAAQKLKAAVDAIVWDD